MDEAHRDRDEANAGDANRGEANMDDGHMSEVQRRITYGQSANG